MAAVEITQDELLEALVSASTAPAEARTVNELAAQKGLSVKKIRDAIGRLAMQDRIVVHQVRRSKISGGLAVVPAYTILPKKKRK